MISKPIPKKMRDEMESDPFMHRCCVTGKPRSPFVKIEWHHAFQTYQNGNKGRLNERWCIVPLWDKVHDKARVSTVKDIIDWIIFNRATDEILQSYSKAEDLIAKRDRLNKRFGVWKEGKLPKMDGIKL